MFDLNLPAYACKIREVRGKKQLFDPVRRKYVALTPEEWVRQHFVHYLLAYKGYPEGRLRNEVRIRLNGMIRRCDTIVYGNNAQPIAIIEYKSPSTKITQAVFEQIAAYNWELKVTYLMVSNGLSHYCCRYDYDQKKVSFLTDVPAYADL